MAQHVEVGVVARALANVDELRDVAATDLLERAEDPLPDPTALDASLTDTLDSHERTLIVRALSAAGGNVAEASRRLKTDRANLYRRMRRLGIPVGDE